MGGVWSILFHVGGSVRGEDEIPQGICDERAVDELDALRHMGMVLQDDPGPRLGDPPRLLAPRERSILVGRSCQEGKIQE